jgi:tRNA1Val (adenine37-N6)-methyltransferase
MEARPRFDLMMADFTIDSIWNSTVQIRQSKRGYRFALDAVLLAHFLKLEAHENALEIGTGNGIIPVLLSQLKPFARITAIEVQPQLAELAKSNIEINGLRNVEIVEADVRQLSLPPHSFDLIFSNPPYRKAGSGKLNPSSEKAIARHELKMQLSDLFECAGKYLQDNGRMSVILPVFREKDFLSLATTHGLASLEHQYVHSFAHEPPAFFLATVGAQGGLTTHPPLVIYESPAVYTTAMQRLLTTAAP